MRDEITRAGSLLQRLGVPQAFAMRLAEILAERYKGHWHADAVARGQAFRCLRSTTRETDPALRRCAEALGAEGQAALQTLHALGGVTVWIDPGEVSYRLGDTGSIQTVVVDAAKAPVAPVSNCHAVAVTPPTTPLREHNPTAYNSGSRSAPRTHRTYDRKAGAPYLPPFRSPQPQHRITSRMPQTYGHVQQQAMHPAHYNPYGTVYYGAPMHRAPYVY